MIINSIPKQNNFFFKKNSVSAKKETGIEKPAYSYEAPCVYFGRDVVDYNNSSLPPELKKRMPKGVSIAELIELSRQEDNIIGQGANSTVYNIPYLDDYVLKVLNKDDPNKIDMNEFPSNVNLGQPVWQDRDNPRLIILKKVQGKEHSIGNWSKTIWSQETYSPLPVTKEQSLMFSSQLDELADFPQSAFDSLAADLKLLEDKGYKIDSINPNNLIVDKEKRQIHIIDYFKVNPKERELYRNSYMDITAVMLDFTLFPEYFDKMDEQSKIKTLKNVDIINEKVYKAAEKAGLSLDNERFKTYIRTTSRWFTAHSVPNDNNGGMYFRYYDVRMEDFFKMLENPVKWAVQR